MSRASKKHGVRIGNWLTAEQGKRLLDSFDDGSLRGKRDYAMVAVLLGAASGGRRLAALTVEIAAARRALGHRRSRRQRAATCGPCQSQLGQGGGGRLVDMPPSVYTGPVFRAINKAQRIGKSGFSPKVIWGVVKAGVLEVWFGSCCSARSSSYLRPSVSRSRRGA